MFKYSGLMIISLDDDIPYIPLPTFLSSQISTTLTFNMEYISHVGILFNCKFDLSFLSIDNRLIVRRWRVLDHSIFKLIHPNT